MRILGWIGVILVLVSLLFITLYEEKIREKYFKEEIIRKAPPVDCVFNDVDSVPNNYYSVGLYFSGVSNFNGHLSLDKNKANKEIFCPLNLSAKLNSGGVEFLRVRCLSNANCHVYSSQSNDVLGFEGNISSCSFKNNCDDDEVCILRVSNSENAHIADCSYSGYTMAVCCAIISETEPECVNDSDCAQGQVCENGQCVSSCGNGILESWEDCDCGNPWDCSDGNGYDLGNQSCVDIGFDEGFLGCYGPGTENECMFNLSLCESNASAICGDGIIDIDLGEYCDINNSNLDYCMQSPEYNSSMSDMNVSCVQEDSNCRCVWSPISNVKNRYYNYSDCYCPELGGCVDKGVKDKILVIEYLNGSVSSSLEEVVECDLPIMPKRRFGSGYYFFIIFLIFVLGGIFFGVNYYLKKKHLNMEMPIEEE
jgi:Cys-rich repeat protein